MLVTGTIDDGGDTPVEPDKALGGSVLLLLKLVEDEVLEGLGECGSSELAVTDFLKHVSCALSMHSREQFMP
mgnify:CR=1 FL=1